MTQVQQKKYGTQFDKYDAFVCYKKPPLDKSYTDKMDTIKAQLSCHKSYKEYQDQMTATTFAKSQLLAWQLKVSNCLEYSNLAMLAFEFNKMNNILLGKPLNFKEALFINTMNNTGDHIFVLIEGKSGTIFALDPWSRTVVELDPAFINLFSIKPDSDNMIQIPETLNKKLNLLYKDTYYDVLHVREATKWYLDVGYSKKVQGFAHENNNDIKDFYNALRPVGDRPKFPQWILDYDELLPEQHTVPSTVEPEEKKPELDKTKTEPQKGQKGK